MNKDEIAGLLELLPAHKASLTLTHNNHLDYYRTVEQEFENDTYYDEESFPEGEREKCIAANELWTLHWYPHTPVGFSVIHASTLEAVFRALIDESKP